MYQPFYLNQSSSEFPPPSKLIDNGIAAFGEYLNPEVIINGYRKGYFPWAKSDSFFLWFHPDPRFVLFPKHLHISKSMHSVMHKYRFTFDKCFHDVIHSCRTVSRENQQGGTWISEEFEKAYTKMFELGYAHSAEAWEGKELVGGLYGIRFGDIFFGESMFAKKSNASKFTFINFVQEFEKSGGKLVDCQQQTSHLASLGAQTISRREFVGYLEKWIPQNENVW